MMFIIVLIILSFSWESCDGFRQVPRYPVRISKVASFAAPPTINYDTQVNNIAKDTFQYLQTKSLSSIISCADLKASLFELRSNPSLLSKLRTQYEEIWIFVNKRLKEENRTIEELLGKDLTAQVLKAIESLDIYDPTSVNSFLANPVFESMLGGILYEGIFEFLQRVDLIGGIINRLPIIGPLRQAVIKEFKTNLDRTLGGSIKTFLTSSFNKIAVQRMVEFILSPNNRVPLQAAQRDFAVSFLKKKLNTLLPTEGSEMNLRVKNLGWKLIAETSEKDISYLIDWVYSYLGDLSLSEVLFASYDEIVQASPTMEKVITQNVDSFFRSPQGKSFVENIKKTY